MRKIILLSVIFSSLAYAEVNLWEEPLEIEPGYKPLEISGSYKYKSIHNKNNKTKKLENIYFLKSSINDNLKMKLKFDKQEKNLIINPDISYIRYDKYKTPIFNLNFGYLVDTTRYGINFSFADGKDDKDDMKSYQINLYFNSQEEESSIFGTLYLGKAKYSNFEDEKELYYGYSQSYEQKYEAFYYENLYYGFFTNLDISRIETEKKGKNYNNDSIDGNIGVFLEKNIIDNLYINFYSGIGKEFLKNRKYKNLLKDEFEEHLNGKIEIINKLDNYLDLFTGVELKKSLKTSNYESSIYVGFKINL